MLVRMWRKGSSHKPLVGIYIDVVTLKNTPEKAMATHSSTVAWKIPWMEEPGGLKSIGLLRVSHD